MVELANKTLAFVIVGRSWVYVSAGGAVRLGWLETGGDE